MQIIITLHRNRSLPGELFLIDGETRLLVCRCLGKADSLSAAEAGNPTRDPFRRYGDTPTGKYQGSVDPPRVPAQGSELAKWLRSYGQWPTIRLEPVSGDALTAKNNGRRGLLIHGGDPNNVGNLRPTNGCIRVDNVSQLSLVEALRKVTSFQVEITEA